MGTVTHTQRLILDAIESLERLEEGLRGRVQAPELGARLDSLIGDLRQLVARAGEGRRDAVRSYDDARTELAGEAAVRARGQEGRLCA